MRKIVVTFLLFINASYGATFFLPLPQIKQKPDFCGEASLSMILKYYGKNFSQDYIHNTFFNLKKIKRGAYSNEIIHALKKNGYKMELKNDFTFKTRDIAIKNAKKIIPKLKKFIKNGYPVFFGWYPKQKITRKFLGHFSIIIGYNKNAFFILDPRYKKHILLMKYNDFCNYFPMPDINFKKWGIFYFVIER